MARRICSAVRRFVRRRAKNKCERCGASERGSKKARQLKVHHIKPRWKFPKLVNDPNNCELLCDSCHEKADRQWKVKYWKVDC